MKLPNPTRSRRPGFSLIELLVAISIIAILISLVVVFIVPMLRQGPDMYARDDLSKMDTAWGNFKQVFGLTDAPPVPFKLCGKRSYYSPTAALDQASLQYLNRMFPNLPANWTIDWSGGTTAGFTGLASGVTLDGDQVLVFFLGGIPMKTGATYGCKGFGSIPTDPSNASGFAAPPTGSSAPKWNPFPFNESRLIARSAAAATPHHFLSYIDPYTTNMPYVYFSPGRLANGYNSAYSISFTNSNGQTSAVSAYSKAGTSNPTQFWNPSSYQLLCAGQDGMFGQGGAWSAATPSTSTALLSSVTPTLQPPPGFDDLSNFHDAKMGVQSGS